MKKRVDSNLPMLAKLELFFARRLLIILGVMAAGILLLAIGLNKAVQSASKERARYVEIIDHLSRYALVFNPTTGQGGFVSKQPVSSAMLSRYVLNSFENYFILDRNSFKQGGQLVQADPTDEKSFMNTMLQLPKIKPLASFFDRKDEESWKQLYGYLVYLYGLAKASRLPDSISVDGSRQPQVKFSGRGNAFSVQLRIPVAYSYLGFDGKVHAGVGWIGYSAQGVFDPLKADQNNPYGMVIKSFTTQYIEL